jgi:hypothetical protein
MGRKEEILGRGEGGRAKGEPWTSSGIGSLSRKEEILGRGNGERGTGKGESWTPLGTRAMNGREKSYYSLQDLLNKWESINSPRLSMNPVNVSLSPFPFPLSPVSYNTSTTPR